MRRFVVVIIVLLFTVLGCFAWWLWVNKPKNLLDKKERNFTLLRGETIRDIGYKLNNSGFIHSPIGFFIFVKINNLDGKIQAGKFKLSPNMSLSEIVTSLTHGSADVWITIPEGKRAQEIAETLAYSGITSYSPSWKQILEAKEGYLFPDTYSFPADIDLSKIIDIMQNNFFLKYKEASVNPTVQLTQSNAVILASIVEREGKSKSDMETIASVLENRMAISMSLQVDATVQYALGYQPLENTWWKKNLTTDDLKMQSPFNTYLNPGLPPTPICNPGLNALTAVFHPAKTDYLYYFTDPKGVTHFAKTLDGHNTNIQRYQ